jgi:hypothetical protein
MQFWQRWAAELLVNAHNIDHTTSPAVHLDGAAVTSTYSASVIQEVS